MRKYYEIILHTPYKKVVPKSYFTLGTEDEVANMAAELLLNQAQSDYFRCKNSYPDFEAFCQDCDYTIKSITKEKYYKGVNETMTSNTLEKEIAVRLAAGETPEDIAASFSAALNAAEAATNTKSAQVEDTQMLLNSVAKYVNKYYPDAEFDGISTETTPEEAEAVIKLIDKLFTPPTEKEINQAETFFKMFNNPFLNFLF